MITEENKYISEYRIKGGLDKQILAGMFGEAGWIQTAVMELMFVNTYKFFEHEFQFFISIDNDWNATIECSMRNMMTESNFRKLKTYDVEIPRSTRKNPEAYDFCICYVNNFIAHYFMTYDEWQNPEMIYNFFENKVFEFGFDVDYDDEAFHSDEYKLDTIGLYTKFFDYKDSELLIRLMVEKDVESIDLLIYKNNDDAIEEDNFVVKMTDIKELMEIPDENSFDSMLEEYISKYEERLNIETHEEVKKINNKLSTNKKRI